MEDYKSSVMYFLDNDEESQEDRIKKLEQALRYVIIAIEAHQKIMPSEPLLTHAVEEAKKALQ